jgi:hypothetical protein
VSHAGKFFTSIAVQLANNIPSLRHYIHDDISNRKDIASQSFRDQWSQLVLFPLSKLSSGPYSTSYVLVTDALGECDEDEHIRMILQLLAEAQTLKTARLRVLLTRRLDCAYSDDLHCFQQTKINRNAKILETHTPFYAASMPDLDIYMMETYSISMDSGPLSLFRILPPSMSSSKLQQPLAWWRGLENGTGQERVWDEFAVKCHGEGKCDKKCF